MSWRAGLWQQLLQFRDLIAHSIRAMLGTWPGLLTLAMLLLMLTAAITLGARASREASAQAPSSSALAQIATRTSTPRPTFTATATQSATATRRPPTATQTRTPTVTATQIAASPLIAGSATPTQVVPLPADHTGPQIVPVIVITITATTKTEQTPTPTSTPTVDALALLVPTSTPTLAPTMAPTLPITEALEQPVSGLAGMMATASAESPEVDRAATEEPTVTDAESPAEAVPTAPAPVATAASQPTPDGSVRTAYVPILMYHYLSVPPPDADRIRLDLSVTPDLFAAHLDAIQQAGYTPISLYALLDNLTHGAPLPEKPVVLTFDDGYRDNYINAFPLLRDRGMTATFFIVTDFINDQRPEYLTWDMVREMYAGGMSIEGHGRNHVSLANKDSDYLIWQALGTYESIEHEIGVRPHFISYPAGDYDQLTIEIFRSANYWAGFTTQQGATHRSDNLFQMRRIRVRGATSPEELLRLLELDW